MHATGIQWFPAELQIYLDTLCLPCSRDFAKFFLIVFTSSTNLPSPLFPPSHAILTTFLEKQLVQDQEKSIWEVQSVLHS